MFVMIADLNSHDIAFFSTAARERENSDEQEKTGDSLTVS
jgi:hypothetical protein